VLSVIGTTLAHYEVLERIGVGGMGEVYRARDTKLDRDVALKVLPAAAAEDPERRRRFEREAKAIASLHHPHIVTIFSIEEADGIHFLTMELVRGSTLAEMLPPDGLSLDRLFEIGIPLAEAVHAAHERGVIHRDLKPGNVMLDEEGEVKVLDFGLAKLHPVEPGPDVETMAAGDATREGHVLGTVAYMSPEQAEGKELDRRSDIFSLGVVLYEAITGKQPFTGDTPVSTMSAILRDTPEPVLSLKPLPRHFGRIIQRCLEKSPDRRFQTARDVANELEGLKQEVDSGEVESIPAGVAPGSSGGAGDGRRLWPWFAGAAVVLAAALVWFFNSSRTPSVGTHLVPRQLTSHASVEWAGSWSPDGSFFAFERAANGPEDLFIASTAGGDPVLLVHSPADDFCPRWSPDNRWIAFASNRGGSTGIYLVPPLGGPVRKLAATNLEGLGEESGTALGMQPWSPDGRRIAFSRRKDDQVAIWILDIDSGEESRLTDPKPGEEDGQAAWSFDGGSIVLNRKSAASWKVLIVSAEGGPVRVASEAGSRRHTPGRGGWQGPCWSPDGKQLLLTAENAGIRNLFTVDVSSGRMSPLTSSSIDIGSAAVGRDGRILYSDFSHQTDLYLQGIDGSEPRRLTFQTGSNFGARISPAGDRIVYHSNRAGGPDLWLLQLDSGEERRLTDHPGEDREADWSPDGGRIVFLSQRDGQAQLWIMGTEGGVPTRLTNLEGVRGLPRWSPDGAAIGFLASAEGGVGLWLVDPAGEDPRVVLPGVADFGWYRDSRYVIYTPEGKPTEIRGCDLETGNETLLADEPHLELATSPDGSAFSFCGAESHFNMHLQVVHLGPSGEGLPVVAGAETVAEGHGLWHVHNGGWSPDGTQVVYTRDTDTGDVYVLEGAFSIR